MPPFGPVYWMSSFFHSATSASKAVFWREILNSDAAIYGDITVPLVANVLRRRTNAQLPAA